MRRCHVFAWYRSKSNGVVLINDCSFWTVNSIIIFGPPASSINEMTLTRTVRSTITASGNAGAFWQVAAAAAAEVGRPAMLRSRCVHKHQLFPGNAYRWLSTPDTHRGFVGSAGARMQRLSQMVTAVICDMPVVAYTATEWMKPIPARFLPSRSHQGSGSHCSSTEFFLAFAEVVDGSFIASGRSSPADFKNKKRGEARVGKRERGSEKKSQCRYNLISK